MPNSVDPRGRTLSRMVKKLITWKRKPNSKLAYTEAKYLNFFNDRNRVMLKMNIYNMLYGICFTALFGAWILTSTALVYEMFQRFRGPNQYMVQYKEICKEQYVEAEEGLKKLKRN